jgi:hypothetical protein
MSTGTDASVTLTRRGGTWYNGSRRATSAEIEAYRRANPGAPK